MNISILTLFPEIFTPYFSCSIMGRAQRKNLLHLQLFNIRDFATDSRKTVDDRPYGGGIGMILRIDILHKALSYAQKQFSKTHKKPYVEKVILLDPTGSVFTQNIAQSFIQVDHIILICGHYEGMDARIEHYVDEKISIGEYVLTGGEIPALVISDAVTRLIPGVLSKPQAVIHESFSIPHTHEEPHYTRPRIFKGHSVPEILLSGNHKKICSWRKEKSALKPTT